MILSISSSDETNHLCLDNLAQYIKTLLGANSGTFIRTMEGAVDSLFGEKTFDEMAYSFGPFKLGIR